MSFNISAFRTKAHEGEILHPSHFKVRIFPPANIMNNVGKDYSQVVRDLEFWGEATQVPMWQLGGHQVQRFGYGSAEIRPTMPQYRDFAVTFICDAQGNIWRFFKDWQKFIIENTLDGDKTIYELNYKEDYLADMDIYVYPRIGTGTRQDQQNGVKAQAPTIAATLINAFPMALAAIPLDWGLQNQYVKLTVVFTFTDWVETKIQQ